MIPRRLVSVQRMVDLGVLPTQVGGRACRGRLRPVLMLRRRRRGPSAGTGTCHAYWDGNPVLVRVGCPPSV
ncbi:hypothetical protein HMPREF9056_01658 [Actinomyces sp. oral taxon 170 str. F0386]|nr:hypothetical protein HMPREF9056_01658 [Actinomyces sp. oral taxon 170 str. F0386]